MKVFIIGAGRMGAIIASAFLEYEHEVWLNDTIPAAVNAGVRKINKILNTKYSEEKAKLLLKNLNHCTEYKNVSQCELIIETVFEDIDLKREVFFEIDSLVADNAIIVSNTAALSISELATGLEHQAQVCGMHFYSLWSSFELIEIIPSPHTLPDIVNRLKEISINIGKKPIVCSESAGFIVNRLLVNMINDASNMLMEGTASAADIDEAMQLVLGSSHGPLHLADKMGNDMALLIIENIFKETGDPRYRPSPYLKRMVRAGLLGCKSGRGFFCYEQQHQGKRDENGK